jgi:hypothetical protein
MSLRKWKYGNSWEKYPINKNEIWEYKGSKLKVCDIMEGLPSFMKEADLIYCDPPWNTGNLNSWYTKNNQKEIRQEYPTFIQKIVDYSSIIDPVAVYLEVGLQNVGLLKSLLQKKFRNIQLWNITYYKKNPCCLVRGSNYGKTDIDFNGLDDMDSPLIAMESENFHTVADFCMGRGLIAVSAYKLNKRFLGTELNKRRLSVTISKIEKLKREKNGISFSTNKGTRD